jgi:hypothetical protein
LAIRTWFALVWALVGCEPRFIEEAYEVDTFIAQGKFSSACVGLKMTHHAKDGLRGYTASKLAEYPEIPEATMCVCEALYNAEKGTWDAAVLKGLDGTRREDLAECVVPALADPRVEVDDTLIRGVSKLHTKAGGAALANIAKSHENPEFRALAVSGLRADDDQAPLVLDMMQNDAVGTVRAAAAGALEGRESDKNIREALLTAAREDADPAPRVAAIAVLEGLTSKGAVRGMLCDVLMEDEVEGPRVRAAQALKGTKDKASISCLEKRLLTEEDSSGVRDATLAALGASPAQEAADVLCTAIGPFLKLYVKDEIADKIAGTGIIEAQNNRDYERSYECVQKALAKGGYSCYAQNHLATWFNELGGKAHQPWCPGMMRE